MFVFNFNFKSKNVFKYILIISFILAISLFFLAGYKIITELFGEEIHNNFEIPFPENAEIQPNNYTNVLKEVHDNIDTYIGQKITFTGYVYRISNLKENQFILARDMILKDTNQTVVVGFLCEYDKAKEYENDSWIKVTGKIIKGNYYGEIPVIKIENIEIVSKPENPLVEEPEENYVPTAVIY